MWSLNSSTSEVLDALSEQLKKLETWQYRLSYHADYLEKKWQAEFYRVTDQGNTAQCTGRGETAHAATIDLFELCDVQPVHGSAQIDVDHGRVSIFDRNLNPAGLDRFA